MIGETDKRQFKRQGYKVFDDVFEESVINEARSIVWDSLSLSPDSSIESMKQKEYEVRSAKNLPQTEPFKVIRDTVYNYATELVGNDTLKEPDEGEPGGVQIINNYPQDVKMSNTHLRNIGYGPRGNETTASGHIDGYGMGFKEPGSRGTYIYSMIGATVYLNSVRPGGGGFTVFPGSHWIAQEYFAEHSLESPGFKGQLPALDDDGGWNYEDSLFRQLRPKEIIGPQGTVLFRHMKLLHSASVNQRCSPRMALVCRFDHENADEIKRDAASNIWKYWDGLADIDTNLSEDPIMY